MNKFQCPHCQSQGSKLINGAISFDCGAFSRNGVWSSPDGSCYMYRLENRVKRMRNRIKQLKSELKKR